MVNCVFRNIFLVAADITNESLEPGHTGSESMFDVLGNVFAIACEDFNNQYDIPKGYSYFFDKGADAKSVALKNS